jgi:hypothetical protein
MFHDDVIPIYLNAGGVLFASAASDYGLKAAKPVLPIEGIPITPEICEVRKAETARTARLGRSAAILNGMAALFAAAAIAGLLISG